MSLNWSVKDIEDSDNLCWITRERLPSEGDGDEITVMNPVTEALIWLSISVKLYGITEKNAPEWYARIHFCEVFDAGGSAFLKAVDQETGETKPRPITPEDVRQHIGLKVNVGNETRAKFLAGFRQHLDNFEHAYKKFDREHATV
jgi:hypothetical protein